MKSNHVLVVLALLAVIAYGDVPTVSPSGLSAGPWRDVPAPGRSEESLAREGTAHGTKPSGPDLSLIHI